jgi:hypothetical protein
MSDRVHSCVLGLVAGTMLSGCYFKYEVTVRDPALVAVATPAGMVLPPGRGPMSTKVSVYLTESVAQITLERKPDGSIYVDKLLEDEPLVPKTGRIRYGGSEWRPINDPEAVRLGLAAFPIDFTHVEITGSITTRHWNAGCNCSEERTTFTTESSQPSAWFVTPWSNVVSMGPLSGFRRIWGRKWYGLNVAPGFGGPGTAAAKSVDRFYDSGAVAILDDDAQVRGGSGRTAVDERTFFDR